MAGRGLEATAVPTEQTYKIIQLNMPIRKDLSLTELPA